jgi:hypothetical protein
MYSSVQKSCVLSRFELAGVVDAWFMSHVGDEEGLLLVNWLVVLLAIHSFFSLDLRAAL